MQCRDVKNRLDTAPASADLTADEAVRAHLRACDDCRDYAEDLRLTRLLASLPVPPVREGFADRALARAWETAHSGQSRPHPARYAWVGLAASVLLAVVLVVQWTGPRAPTDLSPGSEVVQVVPDAVRPVQVRLVSKDALPDATITLRLEGDVELSGYPGRKTLSWQAPIAAGQNELALPVSLSGRESGTITIEVSARGARKQMRLAVQPAVASPTPGYQTSI